MVGTFNGTHLAGLTRGEYSSKNQIFFPNATMLGSKSSPNFPHFCALIAFFLDKISKDWLQLHCGIKRDTYLMHSRIEIIIFHVKFCYFVLFYSFQFYFFPSPQILPQRENIIPRYLSQNNGRIFTPGTNLYFNQVWR